MKKLLFVLLITTGLQVSAETSQYTYTLNQCHTLIDNNQANLVLDKADSKTLDCKRHTNTFQCNVNQLLTRFSIVEESQNYILLQNENSSFKIYLNLQDHKATTVNIKTITHPEGLHIGTEICKGESTPQRAHASVRP